MVTSLFTRAAFAAGLLASTTSASFNAAAKTNVAMYWGQGSNQISLLEVCQDPNIDIVNIGFVNKFPSKRGEYPGTNHANACGDATYIDPTTNQPSKLLSSCPGVGEAINVCRANGKKVMLSLGGGWPTNYYLPTPDVANWFAEFLIGAYGPITPAWKAAGKPRPFGDAFVDGFDLDLEAAEWDVPADMIWKNYDVFSQYVKEHSTMLLSGAPQCVVPDARIFDALKKVHFDFLFTQFYNTWTCSAAKAVQDMKSKKESTFTFYTWINWLKANSANKQIKLYLGLAAGPDGLPTHKDHYLTPEDANLLVESLKGDSMFGGVMLWEATVSKNNQKYDQSYGAWMKYAVEGTFKDKYVPVVSSSTIRPSSTPASSTPVSKTPTPSAPASKTPTPSAPVSKSPTPSAPASKSPTPSAPVSKSPTPSAPVSSIPTISIPASSIPTLSIPASSIPTLSVPASSIPTLSIPASSIPTLSIPASSIPASSTGVQSSAPVSSTPISSSGLPSTTPASSSIATSSSASLSVYPVTSSSSVDTVSSTLIEPSSVATISASASSISSVEVTPSAGSPSSVATISTISVGPSSAPTISASEIISSSVHIPSGNETSTSCSSSSGSYATGASSSADVYPVTTPEAASSVAYPTGEFSTESAVYPIETYSASKAADYPAESSKGYGEYPAVSSIGYDSTPSVTKKPEQSQYPTVPAGSTTSVVTTTYVDVCPTGLTTVTTTYIATVCTKCAAKPTGTTAVPEGWTTSVYTASTVTVTITKPIATVTGVAEYPSSAPSIAYPAEYPASPVSSGKPAHPAVPEASKAAYPTVPEASKMAEYPVAPAPSKAPEYPAHPAMPSAAQPALSSPAAEYPSYPVGNDYPKKPVEHEAASTMHVTFSKVSVPAYTPAPYMPAGPAKNATSVYVPMPTGTGKPAMPSSSVPAEFEGAASRAGVGFMMLVGAVGAVLVM